ncbi:unnamed protein product [Polarella glacialis]|uniref:60S ribosomal protein L17 n=2 Tax=Polarella glacialis TaxID=89957 RepID=A0A813KAA9_POLGL|nr:unnamed protein product [Polarella glacialis]
MRCSSVGGLLLASSLALLNVGQAQIMSIDLGHEFFKVALMRQGVPLEIVLNGHSKRKTATATSFWEASRVFGDDALTHVGKAPDKVPMFYQHMLGWNFTSEADVAVGGDWWKSFALGDKFYKFNLGYGAERGAPTFKLSDLNEAEGEEVLASIIFFAKQMAEESAEGKPVRDLVVTVPSDATLRQRQAIVAAGEIAGCRVLSLVHETSAFAVQRAVDVTPDKGVSEVYLFYNAGSRKTEVSLVRFESRIAGMVAGKLAPVLTVLGSANRLKAFQEKYPKLASGVEKDPRALRKLLTQAQKTKAILSSNKVAPFIVESLFQDQDFQSTINRAEFEKISEGIFSRLTAPVEKALKDANLTMKDVNHVEVVGGAWRVPKVQEMLSEYFKKEGSSELPLGQHLNGEEAAAMGGALMAANFSSSFRVKKIFFSDITAHEYAVQVTALDGSWEKNLTTLYPVGTLLGGKKKLSFSLEEDFMVKLFEDGVLMSEYSVTGLKELLDGKWKEYNITGPPKITASVPLEMSGIIEVKQPLVTIEELYWVNNATEKAKEDDAEPEPLTEARIKELKKKMEDQAEKEAEVGALAGLKNGLEAAIYGSRDKLEKDEIIKVSTEPQREEVTKLCNELEEQDWTGLKKTDYENQLKTLQDLLGPLEERALEYEARADLPDTVKEALDAVKQMQAHIAKNMSWVNSSKTEAAEKKTDELKEWWSKKTKQQKELPLSEAPAYTKVDVLEKLSKLKKEWQKIMKLKKPKEVKPKKGKASNATSADDSAKAEEPAVPGTVEEVEKELAELREKKIAAVENEDFDAAHVLKQREQALVKQLAKLKEDGEAAEKPDSTLLVPLFLMAAKCERYPAVASEGLLAAEPFCTESFGRLGPAALRLLHAARQRAAEREPNLRGWAGIACFNRWLALLSCELQRAMFDASQAMWGATGRLAAVLPEGLPLIATALPFAAAASNPSKACKAQGVDLRVHYKNTYETAQAIKGMSLQVAKKYLQDVCEKKRCIPFRKYTGCIGRTPQAKEFKMSQGRWPVKSCKIVLGLLQNAESNAEFKNLDTENLYIQHIQVNVAQCGRRRTYRAHGRIGPYMNVPCHVEMILAEKEEAVEKPEEDVKPKKFTRKQLAMRRLAVGGGQ